MKLLKLDFQNFMSYKHAIITIPKNGIVLIYGHDIQKKISVGVGKSAIKEVLTFVVFGRTKFTDLDDAINFAEKEMKGSLLFILNSKMYFIARSKKRRKTTRIDVFKEVVVKDKKIKEVKNLICETNTLTQQKINELLGINYEKFLLIYSFGQSEYDDLKRLRSGKLVELFLEMFNLNKFDEINEYLKTKKREFEDAIIILDERIETQDLLQRQQERDKQKKKRNVKNLVNRLKRVDKIFNATKKEEEKSSTLEDSIFEQIHKLKNQAFGEKEVVKMNELQQSRLNINNKCPLCFTVLTKDKMKLISNEYAKRVEERKNKIDLYTKSINECNERYHDNRNICAALGKKFQRAKRIHIQIAQIVKDLTVDDKKEKLKIIDIEKVKNKIKKLKNKSMLFDKAKPVFDKMGFSYYILEQDLSELEVLINNYLIQITDFSIDFETCHKLKTSDKIKYELEIKLFKNNHLYSLENLSNGQEFLVTLCIRLGLSELFTRRFGKEIETLIIDDEFGKTDQNTNLKIIDLINNLNDTKYFKNIILMTHSSDIRNNIDMSRLAKNIYVTMNNEESTV